MMASREIARTATLVGALSLLAACGSGGEHVRLPPKSASPQRVVAAYVAAANAHDFAAALKLVTPARAQILKRTVDGSFSPNFIRITSLHMSKPFSDSYEARLRHYRYAVDVPVSFDLHQHQVVSMPNGAQPWGYILVRNSPSQRWLIADEGTG
jgi:hypothetical protein